MNGGPVDDQGGAEEVTTDRSEELAGDLEPMRVVVQGVELLRRAFP